MTYGCENLGGHMYGGMYGFIGIIWWIILILMVTWLVLWFTKRSNFSLNEKPLDILQRRYAKGEITKQQYIGMKKELGGRK